LAGLLQSDAWGRFNHYAQFVRNLDYHFPLSHELSIVTEWRSRHLDGGYFLPNLRELHIMTTLHDDVRMLRHLLAPKITVLQLGFDSEDQNERDQLDAQLQYAYESLALARNVTKLAVYRELAGLAFPDTLIRLSRSLSSLHALKTLAMSVTLFVRLAQTSFPTLPVLESLRLDSVGPHIEGEISFMKVVHALPSLRSVKGEQPCGLDQLAIFWFPFLASPLGISLREIVMETPATYEQFNELVSIIGRNCQGVQSLTLGVHFADLLKDYSDMLNPLTRCKELRNVTIGAFHNPASFLTHKALTRLVSAWPELETLHLSRHTYAFCPPQASRPKFFLATIATICSSCPRLRSITLSVDATTLPEPHNLPPRYLAIGFDESWIEKPEDVALWLGNICYAEGLRYSREFGSRENAGLWKEVKNALSDLGSGAGATAGGSAM
jgi:hypothetical protein